MVCSSGNSENKISEPRIMIIKEGKHIVDITYDPYTLFHTKFCTNHL